LYKVLHIEPTDVCQAACPLCARETDTEFNSRQQHHLTIEQIKQEFSKDFIRGLDKMFMCGNYGDPAAGRHTLAIFRYFREVNPDIVLGMNTNGAVQHISWWSELAGILNQPKDYVVFSIDGLKDTNHIYRKNVAWSKLMDNAETFIAAEGRAQWDMLVYQHNEHQVDACEELARAMKFTWFRAKISRRPYVKGLEFPAGWQRPNVNTGPIDCIALKESSIYMDAQGRVSPCCWLGSRQSNFIRHIEEVAATWDNNPNPVCRDTCSTANNSFANQWQREVELC